MLWCCQLSFAQQQITVGADDWIDYTAADGGGIYFELLKKVYPDLNITFKIQPLNKSIADFNAQKLDVIVGVYKHELTHALFPQWYLDTEYPLHAFYNKKMHTIDKLSDLIALKPAWPSWYSFKHFLPSVQQPLVVKSLTEGFDALKKNQTDIFIEYDYNLPENIPASIASVKVLPAQHLYVAFQHNQFGRKLIKTFDQQMLSLRKQGFLAKLYGEQYPHTGLGEYVVNKQKITIYTNSVSLLSQPYLVKSNTKKEVNEGQTLALLFNSLNGYQIEFKPFKNIAKMYQQGLGDNACFSDLINTPKRSKEFWVSKPLSLFLGQKLYSNVPLKVKEPIDLQALLNDQPQKRLGTINGRNYGQQLDTILTKISRKQLIQSPVDIKTLFKQFKRNRFNLIIEYPLFEQYYNQNGHNKSLFSYSIAGADDYILGHMMCVKSAVGKHFIEQFNQLIERYSQSVYFFNAQYQRVPAGNKAKFIQYFQQTFPLLN